MTLTKLGFKTVDKHDREKAMRNLAAGAAAGSIANLLVAPIDAIKDVQKQNRTNNRIAEQDIQAGRRAAETYHPAPTRAWEVAKNMWHHERGFDKLRPFYESSGTALLKVAPLAAAQFVLYEYFKDKLNAKKRH